MKFLNLCPIFTRPASKTAGISAERLGEAAPSLLGSALSSPGAALRRSAKVLGVVFGLLLCAMPARGQNAHPGTLKDHEVNAWGDPNVNPIPYHLAGDLNLNGFGIVGGSNIPLASVTSGSTSILVRGKSYTGTISSARTIVFAGPAVEGQQTRLTVAVPADSLLTIPVSYMEGPAGTQPRTSRLLSAAAYQDLIWERRNGVDLLIDTEDDLGTVADRGIAKEITIAARGDSRPGSGTKDDPFNGRTASDFDILLAGYQNAGVTNLTINLPSESYNSNFAWSPLQGWKIRGAGKWRTVITNTGFNSNQSACIRCNVTTNNVEISDLTIDVNGSTLTNTVGGVQLRGSNCLARGVRVTHAKASVSECFPLFVWAGADSIVSSRIEDCEVDNFVGTNGTMLGVSTIGSNPAATVSDCVVRGNYVHDCTAQAYGGFGNGVDCLHEDNRADNVFAGLFSDSYNSTRLVVKNDTFTHVQLGVVFKPDDDAASRLTDTTFSGIVVLLNDAFDVIGFQIDNTNGQINGLTVENCTVFYAGTAQHATNQWGFEVTPRTGLIARGNRANSILRSTFEVDTGAEPTFGLNTDTNGGPMFYSAADASPRLLAIAGDVTHGNGVTFAQLPSAPTKGTRVLVTDSNTATWGATAAGGGSNAVVLRFNGTVWKVAEL